MTHTKNDVVIHRMPMSLAIVKQADPIKNQQTIEIERNRDEKDKQHPML